MDDTDGLENSVTEFFYVARMQERLRIANETVRGGHEVNHSGHAKRKHSGRKPSVYETGRTVVLRFRHFPGFCCVC